MRVLMTDTRHWRTQQAVCDKQLAAIRNEREVLIENQKVTAQR